MSRPPIKRTPRAAGPANTSTAAGRAAPASAAATPAFYSPADGAAPGSAAAAHEEHLSELRQTLGTHVSEVAAQAIDDEEVGGTADASLSSHIDPDAPPSREEINRIRSLRKPLGAYSQKLALPTRKGYHRHWFNDVAGRVDEALANGWANVKDKDGKPTKRAVGTGRDNGVMYAYALELPEVFWLEDMAARHAQASATIAATKANPFKAAPGSAKPSDKGKFYSPTEEPMTVEVR